jgi:hypothetical protein
MIAMRNRAIELFYAVAGLGAVLALVSVGQAAVSFGSRLAYTLRPWLIAGFWSLVIVLALVLAVAAYFAFIWFRSWRYDIRIDQAGRAAATVTPISDHRQTWLVNPLNLPIINASHDWRLTINQMEPEMLPDQWQAIRMLKFLESQQSSRAIKLPELPLLPESGLQPVLPAIIGSQRLLVAGGMGSGKTNLLRWIAAEKSKASRVLVIDTHAAPGLWPVDPQAVLGRGRNWAGVEMALQNLLGIMDRRYKDIDAGTVGYRGHEIITVIADEWTMIPQMIGADTIKNYSKPVLVESRKVGIDFVLATHDTTVEALGTKGMSGLKTAFDFIVETQHRAGQYICRVRKPGQKPSEAVEYAAPPLFSPDAAGRQAVAIEEPGWITALKPPPVSVEIDEPGELTDDEPTKEEFGIMVAYNQAKNENGDKPPLNQVCKKLGWRAGGIQYEKIRQAMRRWTDEDL